MSDKIDVEQNDEIDFLEIVGIVIKNIKTVVIITLIFMFLSLALAIISIVLPPEKSFLPNKFSPRSIVMLNSSDSVSALDSMLASSGMGNLAGLAGIQGGTGGISDSQLASKLVTTHNFIEKINEEFNLDTIYETNISDYPETNLRNAISERLTLYEDEDTGLLTISYTDIDKRLATNIVNRVTDLLEEEFNKIDIIRNKNQLSVIRDKKATVEIELDRLQNEILAFQNHHNLIDVNVVFSELIKQVSELQAQLLMKNVAIDSYSQISSIRDPGYLKLISERDAIAKAIEMLENGTASDYPPLEKLPELALELEYLKRELDVQATVYKSLITQIETLKLTADGTGPTFQVLEKARIPEKKSEPSRGKLCIMMTLGGFFFSIFFIFCNEIWSNIKKDPIKLNKLKGKKQIN